MKTNMRALLTLALCAPAVSMAEDVTVDTFVRAESDYNFQANMQGFNFGETHPDMPRSV